MSVSHAPDLARQIERANTNRLTPVVFIHGLWLLPDSWDRWAAVFEQAGYAPVQPGWPDDPRHGRGGQRPSRGVRAQDRGTGRRPLRVK